MTFLYTLGSLLTQSPSSKSPLAEYSDHALSAWATSHCHGWYFNHPSRLPAIAAAATCPWKSLDPKPKSAILVESIGLILNVLTLSIFRAVSGHLAMNNIGLAYVSLLQLVRAAIGPDGNRQALRHHIDAILVGMSGLILATEGLDFVTITSEYSIGRPVIRAAASLCCWLGFAVLTPHEWVAQADDFLHHAFEPTYEETHSWIDYCFASSRASNLVQQANGRITVDYWTNSPLHTTSSSCDTGSLVFARHNLRRRARSCRSFGHKCYYSPPWVCLLRLHGSSARWVFIAFWNTCNTRTTPSSSHGYGSSSSAEVG